ncbi:MAG TPA: YlxR family protein [Anaeromyxobacter sp.]
MSAPVRTCVGCGARAVQGDLVRLRIVGASVTIDRQRTGGRGAWLHPSEACLERATRRRAFVRAFRGAEMAIDVAELRVGLTGNARKD